MSLFPLHDTTTRPQSTTTVRHMCHGAHKNDSGAHKNDSGAHKNDSGAHKNDSGAHKNDSGAHKNDSGAHGKPRNRHQQRSLATESFAFFRPFYRAPEGGFSAQTRLQSIAKD